jgi:hypothetical protein
MNQNHYLTLTLLYSLYCNSRMVVSPVRVQALFQIRTYISRMFHMNPKIPFQPNTDLLVTLLTDIYLLKKTDIRNKPFVLDC